MTIALLRAQTSTSTDPRYHEGMALELQARGRLWAMFSIAALAFAAARATDLAFLQGFLLPDTLALVKGHGFAPDQYRYLPHVLVLGLAQFMNFKAALEVFTFLSLLGAFWLMMFVAWQERPAIERAAACAFVALIYPLSMFAGPRFDTGLSIALVLAGLCAWRKPLIYLPVVLVLALTRADYALILALFVLVQSERSEYSMPLLYILAPSIPLVVQMALWWIFPNATYVTAIVQIADNLGGDVLKIPGLWYTLGIGAMVVAYARPHLRIDRHALAKIGVLLLYVAMILVVARAREWRLWLPILPLVYALWFGPAIRGNSHARQ